MIVCDRCDHDALWLICRVHGEDVDRSLVRREHLFLCGTHATEVWLDTPRRDLAYLTNIAVRTEPLLD